ncbi:cytochrome b5 domain-containing protein [Heliophilum fasciatum]|uniref:Putative heme/steroid binding protein n=1 Tax=Heliophilum fasciatum TaxID=35700 RepID=A0A4R2S8E5_9FIRM|nr:cytochrome b5 domain-containing protein [Heliophilum fasciatum]MCW2276848.1 putative heme/steroid binding protein [Heliophilum fasciatum]TCP68691.1 putative heme/steroid binding protein [Heliophilum fasciatum]
MDNHNWRYPTVQKRWERAPWQQQQTPPLSLTLAELAQYNGKKGMPAYIAVDGVIYDVTMEAAWAAASHFSLRAGQDLSGPYRACHRGQGILARLKVVGQLR